MCGPDAHGRIEASYRGANCPQLLAVMQPRIALPLFEIGDQLDNDFVGQVMDLLHVTPAHGGNEIPASYGRETATGRIQAYRRQLRKAEKQAHIVAAC